MVQLITFRLGPSSRPSEGQKPPKNEHEGHKGNAGGHEVASLVKAIPQFGHRGSWLPSCRAPQFLQVVHWSEWFSPLLPVVVLVAEEASVLGGTHFRRLSVMTLLTSVDAGYQDVCCFLTGDCPSVARLAVDADVSVVAEDRIGQPDRFDVCRSYFGQSCETVPVGLRVLQ